MRARVHGPLTKNCMKLKQVNKPKKDPGKVTQIDLMPRSPVTFLVNVVIFLGKAAWGCLDILKKTSYIDSYLHITEM